MTRQLKQLLALAVLLLALLFIIFVVNQTAQLVALAAGVSPSLGRAVLYSLLVIYAALIVLPLVWIGRMPRALFPPPRTDTADYQLYLERLARRLNANPHLQGVKVEPGDLAAIEGALQALNAKADERIKSAASNVFVMTAISQYGALDAFIVILAQFRMIWQVTSLYNQRPALRELAWIYSNVFAAAFLASKIENLDILEDQLEPVIASVMGSSLSSLTPAFTTAANIVTNSIIEGAANAFLTLRVGVIAKLYCASLTRQEKGRLRRAAAVQAAALLGKVLAGSAYDVSRAVFRASARASTRPLRYGHEIILRASKNAGKKGGALFSDLAGSVREQGRKWVLRGKKQAGSGEEPPAED